MPMSLPQKFLIKHRLREKLLVIFKEEADQLGLDGEDAKSLVRTLSHSAGEEAVIKITDQLEKLANVRFQRRHGSS